MRKGIVFGRIGLLLIVICSMLLSTGCSNRPSEAEARAAAEKKLKSATANWTKINSFKKTNGMGSDGQYTIEFAAVGEFTNGGSLRSLGSDCANKLCFFFMKDFRWLKLNNHQVLEKEGVCSTGDVFSYNGSVTLIKTENGWQLAPF